MQDVPALLAETLHSGLSTWGNVSLTSSVQLQHRSNTKQPAHAGGPVSQDALLLPGIEGQAAADGTAGALKSCEEQHMQSSLADPTSLSAANVSIKSMQPDAEHPAGQGNAASRTQYGIPSHHGKWAADKYAACQLGQILQHLAAAVIAAKENATSEQPNDPGA